MLDGELIRKRRIKKKLGTQSQAGQLMLPPVSQAKWSRWERGVGHPNAAERKQLAQLLGGWESQYMNTDDSSAIHGAA